MTLEEYVKFRLEVGRELLNAEVDTNFRAVANPWVTYRTYLKGYIVYHEVPDEEVTGTTRLGWFRANTTTTQGQFVSAEWDEIGGGGGGGGGAVAVYKDDIAVNLSARKFNFIGDVVVETDPIDSTKVDITLGNLRVLSPGEELTVSRKFQKISYDFINLGTVNIEQGSVLFGTTTDDAYFVNFNVLENRGTINNDGVLVITST